MYSYRVAVVLLLSVVGGVASDGSGFALDPAAVPTKTGPLAFRYIRLSIGLKRLATRYICPQTGACLVRVIGYMKDDGKVPNPQLVTSCSIAGVTSCCQTQGWLNSTRHNIARVTGTNGKRRLHLEFPVPRNLANKMACVYLDISDASQSVPIARIRMPDIDLSHRGARNWSAVCPSNHSTPGFPYHVCKKAVFEQSGPGKTRVMYSIRDQKMKGGNKHGKSRGNRQRKPSLSLAVYIVTPVVAALLAVLAAGVCIYRRFEMKNTRLEERHTRLLDNVHDLGHVVNCPKTGGKTGADPEHRRRFGSQFFSYPRSQHVEPTTIAAILPASSGQCSGNSQATTTVTGGAALLPARAMDHRCGPHLSHSDSPAHIPGYKSYEPPALIGDHIKVTTSPVARSTEQNEDTLTPLTAFDRHFSHYTTDGNPKALSADHASAGMAKIEGRLGEKVVCSERCEPHVQARALRGTDSQGEIYSHVLGQQCRPDSTSALRRSNLILM